MLIGIGLGFSSSFVWLQNILWCAILLRKRITWFSNGFSCSYGIFRINFLSDSTNAWIFAATCVANQVSTHIFHLILWANRWNCSHWRGNYVEIYSKNYCPYAIMLSIIACESMWNRDSLFKSSHLFREIFIGRHIN